MKRTIKMWMAIATLLFLSAAAVSAQSLGDYARDARKNKPKTDTSKHYDNDNLPTNEQLSVVGPEPAAAATGDQSAAAKTAAAPKAAEADRQKSVDDLQQKIDAKKEKLDGLTHELDLDQREYRLRAAAFYGDAGSQLRNGAQWSKDDAQYKSDMDSKQKAIEAARQELSDLQEQARKTGIKQKETDTDKEKK
jgi:hypothetical protein